MGMVWDHAPPGIEAVRLCAVGKTISVRLDPCQRPGENPKPTTLHRLQSLDAYIHLHGRRHIFSFGPKSLAWMESYGH
jgi:hypothetical protein